MVTYLQILNRARNQQAQTDLSAIAVAGTSGDALQGIQALNKAVSVFHENSFDLDSGEFVSDVPTTTGTSLLSSPSDTWDTNVIKDIKIQDSGATSLRPLTLITLEEAEDYKLKTYQSNKPLFWWVNQTNVYILPVPTTVYTLKVFYQKIYPDITADNINNTVVLPTTGLNALRDLTYAYLREQIGDPQWQLLEQRAENELNRFLQRNKHTYKRKGFRKINIRPRLADRKL